MKFVSAVTLVLAAVLAVPRIAHADPTWPASFPADALSTYLDSTDESLLVAGAGDKVKSATKALIDALRETGKVRLVTDDKSLGNLMDASDADVVAKAKNSPVDVVAVVRVFPGATGKPATAVVTLYNKRSAAVLSAFTVTKGTPVSPRAANSAVPTAAMNSVGDVIGQVSGEASPSSQKLLEEKGVWSANMLIVNANTGAAMASYTDFFKGKHGPPLNGADLFRYIGRKDLADEYQTKMAWKLGLIWGGLGAGVLLGPAIMIWGIFTPGPCTTIDSITNTCTANNLSALFWVGTVLTAVGLVAMIPGFIIQPTSLSANEVDGLVEQFNDNLRKQAGESPSSSVTVDRKPKIAWDIFPYQIAGGAGLAFDLRF